MIKPLFPYYGSKWRDVPRYPTPHTGMVIEPFAGSAAYSLRHEPAHVLLYDMDEIVVGVWQYLIHVSADEIMALPELLNVGDCVDDFDIPQEARWLIGFWLNRGSATPKKTRTAYSARTDRAQLNWGLRAKQRIAESIDSIRHWHVFHESYENAPPCNATYFVDPPYVDKGRHYRVSGVNYERCGEWARALPGQVIVCEQDGATWLPFESLASVKSSNGRSAEAVYLQGIV